MFTGIISHSGTVREKSIKRLTIVTDKTLTGKLQKGMSVAVDGICLTVVDFSEKEFAVDFMPETERKTTIQWMQEDSIVNLELPATPQTFLAGHIVQGHIDGIGKIRSVKQEKNSHIITIDLAENLGTYVVAKGSITINGISLTVIFVEEDTITVGIIPHTWQHTNLHQKKTGQYVTIEVDVMAKYVEKLLRR